MYTVDTFYMTSLITKSIQEMYADLTAENKAIKQLKQENKVLKQRIEVLENQLI